MTKTTKILLLVAFIAVFVLGIYVHVSLQAPTGSASESSLNINNFGAANNKVYTIATSTCTTTGNLILSGEQTPSSSWDTSVFWSVSNFGTSTASILFDATTTGLVYGEGILVAPSTTQIFVGPAIYNGSVSCLTSAGTTSVGVQAQ